MNTTINNIDSATQPVIPLSAENIYVHFVTNHGPRLIEVTEVVEIIPMVQIDASQRSSGNREFAGLINYRGKIIPVFDITNGESCREPDINHFLIVAATAANSLAIIATEVTQLVSVIDSDISSIKPLNGESFRMAKVHEHMVRIVKTDEFVRT